MQRRNYANSLRHLSSGLHHQAVISWHHLRFIRPSLYYITSRFRSGFPIPFYALAVVLHSVLPFLPSSPFGGVGSQYASGASEKKVSTRVRGAAWRRKDAPKARGVSFPGRHEGVEEQGEINKKQQENREERKMRYC